jgi:hypothetical protein
LTIVLAAVGLLVAVFGGVYGQLTDASHLNFDAVIWIALIVFCPPSLIFVSLIDVEPGTAGFVVTWLAIAVVNSALYAVIGLAVGRLAWRSGSQSSNSLAP